MSVGTPYRSESAMAFIHKTYSLNVKIGTTVAKLPIKYKVIYGDDMAKVGLEALRLLQTGNGVFIGPDTLPEMFVERIKMFETAKGFIYNIPTIYRLCVLVRTETEKPDAATREKWMRQAQAVADLCNECVALIGGVIKSDKKRYKECQNK